MFFISNEIRVFQFLFVLPSLFPMMPRHNLYKIQADVLEICRKHNIPYVVKPMGQAFYDILT